MLQSPRDFWNTPANFYTELKFPQQFTLEVQALPPQEFPKQFELNNLSNLQKLAIVGSQTSKQIHALLTTLPSLTNLELLSFTSTLAPDLNKQDKAWWGPINPASDPSRFELAELLLDRTRFPKLLWVVAGDAAWKIQGGVLNQPYISHEPGIDFL
jgi:hypothetical protein